MLNFRRQANPPANPELRMSAMIDIVFLLLVFFVMTFRIVPMEGDFNVDFGNASQPVGEESQQLPLHLSLSADGSGRLLDMRLNGRLLSGRPELQQLLLSLADEGSLRDQSLLLECDDNLVYDEVITTLDAVTGRRDAAGVVRPLIGQVKFVSP